MIPKVNSGDRLRIRAQDWNTIADHVNATHLGATHGSRTRGLYAINGFQNDLLAGQCFKLNGVARYGEELSADFAERQVFNLVFPRSGETNYTFAILQDDILQGDIGRIALDGTCYALFSSYDSALPYAEPDGQGKLRSASLGNIEVVYVDAATLQGIVIIGGAGGAGAQGGYFDLKADRSGDGWICTVFNSGETELSGSANGYEISGRVVVGNYTAYMPVTSVPISGPGVVYLYVAHDGQSHGSQPYLGFSSGFAFASAMPSIGFDERRFQAPLGYLRYRNGTDDSNGYIVTRTSHSRGGAIELSGRWI